jgi:hypothetical protein
MWYFVDVSSVNKGGNNGEDVVKLILIFHFEWMMHGSDGENDVCVALLKKIMIY